ncbi:MAG: cytochrome c oxidase assembly protein [Rhodobacteraceae bacterium]|nr:cytochrome c oxidase assembly protein [Paracoccaceae bacterium]
MKTPDTIRHAPVVVKLLALVTFMGAMSFAAVPLYDWFCRVTGFGGTTGVASAGSDVILDQTMRVRFDASKERGFPWEFRPVEREIEVRIGESGLAFYEAYNPTDRPVAGTATFNVVPFSAGQFFIKVECFCFQEQVLQPGERVQMPVSYFIDPAIVNHPEARHVQTITLSYTFYEMDLPAESAHAAPAEAEAVTVN